MMEPISMDNPFAALGLSARFDLDPGAIRRAWLTASGRLHPDRAGGDPLEESEIARRSAQMNEAKRVLDDPESRADALLRLLGGPAKEEDKSLPDGFLMEMMGVREDLESAADDPSKRQDLERWATEQREGHIARVGALFAEAGEPADAGSLTAIRMELNAWRYIERMLEQIDPAEGAQA